MQANGLVERIKHSLMQANGLVERIKHSLVQKDSPSADFARSEHSMDWQSNCNNV